MYIKNSRRKKRKKIVVIAYEKIIKLKEKMSSVNCAIRRIQIMSSIVEFNICGYCAIRRNRWVQEGKKKTGNVSYRGASKKSPQIFVTKSRQGQYYMMNDQGAFSQH